MNPLLPLLPSRPELLVSALKGPFGALMVRYLNFWLDGFEQGLLVALAAQRRARWTRGAVRRQSARNFRGARAGAGHRGHWRGPGGGAFCPGLPCHRPKP